jgi:hypothetical protein
VSATPCSDCPMCDQSFTGTEAMLRHLLQTHSNTAPFGSDGLYSYQLINRDQLDWDIHCWCGVWVIGVQEWVRHLDSAGGITTHILTEASVQTNYDCPLCEEHCLDQGGFINHLLDKHVPHSPDGYKHQNPEQYQFGSGYSVYCWCGNGFTDKQSFGDHIKDATRLSQHIMEIAFVTTVPPTFGTGVSTVAPTRNLHSMHLFKLVIGATSQAPLVSAGHGPGLPSLASGLTGVGQGRVAKAWGHPRGGHKAP